MITGYNTDVSHGGVTYHVQTEDKGLNSPIILSLVYTGGEILASKRTPYDDLIASGFSEHTLAERLQRQHKLICAAIHAGRIEDLKRMGAPTAEALPAIEPEKPEITTPPILEKPVIAPPETPSPFARPTAPPPVKPFEQPHKLPPPTVRTQAPGKADFARVKIASQPIHLSLLEEVPLRAGDFMTLRVSVSQGTADSRVAIPNVPVTLKVLGTSFQPIVSTAQTDHDGIAFVFAPLPRFTKGRAAILLHAAHDGFEAELRRIILPA